MLVSARAMQQNEWYVGFIGACGEVIRMRWLGHGVTAGVYGIASVTPRTCPIAEASQDNSEFETETPAALACANQHSVIKVFPHSRTSVASRCWTGEICP